VTRQRTAVVVTATVALVAVAGLYLWSVPDPDPGVVLTLIAGIAGLGGYEVRERSRGGE